MANLGGIRLEKRSSSLTGELVQHFSRNLAETLDLNFVALDAFAVFLEVQLERFHIVVKAKRGHGEEDVFAVYGLSFLSLWDGGS